MISGSKSNKLRRHIEKVGNMSDSDVTRETCDLIASREEVDVDLGYLRMLDKISTKKNFGFYYTQFAKYAAIFIFPLLAASIWLVLNNRTQPDTVQPLTEDITYQEITCPVGMRSKVLLPDGSEVWLNADTKLSYSIPFALDTRSLELAGEAYFKVRQNLQSPFVVESNNVQVKVTGTEFNFKSYEEDEKIEVALIEGSVDLSIYTDNKEVSRTGQLIPNDHLIYKKTTGKTVLKNHDIRSCIAWKDNRLIFDETPLFEMKKVLERWYGIEIEIANRDIASYRFTTTFENESLLQLKELLELSSPIRIRHILGKINKQTKEITKSKLIITKKLN